MEERFILAAERIRELKEELRNERKDELTQEQGERRKYLPYRRQRRLHIHSRDNGQRICSIYT